MEVTESRINVARLLYVSISGGSGLVLNLSERGMAIQTMVELELGQLLQFALHLPEEEFQFTGTAKVAWCDCSGRAGLHFVDVPEQDSVRWRHWLAQSEHRFLPSILCKAGLKNLGSSKSSALVNAEVNCLEYLAS